MTARAPRRPVRSVPAATLVRGDIVELAAGNLVPADGVLLAARDFLVVEASLTGESLPVEKRPGSVGAAAAARAAQLRVPRHLGAQRHGEPARGADRQPHGAGRCVLRPRRPPPRATSRAACAASARCSCA
ncbi:MAG: hypothetical protein U1F25_17210 [Rubrivivax sp.]